MVSIRRLIWDPWNVAHIARHQVTPEEAEEVCHGPVWTSATYAGRLRVVGPTQAGRMITVILAPRDSGIYYPVTARPASRKERKLYLEEKGGQTP